MTSKLIIHKNLFDTMITFNKKSSHGLLYDLAPEAQTSRNQKIKIKVVLSILMKF